MLALKTAFVAANIIAVTKNSATPSTLIAKEKDLTQKKKVVKSILLLDVDNTLYSEKRLKLMKKRGIEQQIIENTYSFCKEKFNMTKTECDDLYREYGSTPEGLRDKFGDDSLFPKFYDSVYKGIDMNGLFVSVDQKDDSESNMLSTGYSHNETKESSNNNKHHDQSSSLKQLLEIICKEKYVYLASNSPLHHIRRIVSVLGLQSIPFSGFITPDSPRANDEHAYPTKALPDSFFSSLFDTNDDDDVEYDITFMDDSLYNLKMAKDFFSKNKKVSSINCVHVSHEQDIVQALENFQYHPPPDTLAFINRMLSGKGEKYEFDETQYLIDKNKVDAKSMNRVVWDDLCMRLSKKNNITIVDLGAGLFSMLNLFLNGFPEQNGGYLLKSKEEIHLDYYGFESNPKLREACLEKLHSLGFSLVSDQDVNSGVYKFCHKKYKNVCVHFIASDFYEHEPLSITPDLIVGCCFADLFPRPNELIQRILQLSNMFSSNKKLLLYFPITFAGATLFDKPRPSDHQIFQEYSNLLKTELSHNLDPNKITEAVIDHGGTLLAQADSNWNIEYSSHPYLWNTMMYFIHSLLKKSSDQHDLTSWFSRAYGLKPAIIAWNVDLFYEFDPDKLATSNVVDEEEILKEVEFIAPKEVVCRQQNWNTRESPVQGKLGPNQISVQSICSLISSGTELKIFRGTFESDEPLDVNIKDMADKKMSYPMKYGYSLVGKITHVGSDISPDLIGRNIFTFSPHTSHLICDFDQVMLVPADIKPQDAIFLPSMETALSILHDASPRIGENVGVFGQGLIGLLITSILSLTHKLPTSSEHGTVTVFDTFLDRLNLAYSLGASDALLPPTKDIQVGPFDVTIEVSGNGRALQSAIDYTKHHGRIIIGSWYSSKNGVNLDLGLDFHRSHKTIMASQVSEIPPSLKGVWNKQRRFGLTWELLKQIEPSGNSSNSKNSIISKWLPVTKAQEAYEALDSGKEICVAFYY